MWRFFDDRMLFISESPENSGGFEFMPIILREYRFHGTLIKIPLPEDEYRGFDDWRAHFPQEEELSLVRHTLQMAQSDPTYRAHIQGISLAESIELLREYYRDCGYEDALAKNYILPLNIQITASVSLRHALWCEKDKHFLSTKDATHKPF